ncbi:MAG: phage holin family protein [bacterium]
MRKLITAFLANAIALFIAGTYIHGVTVPLGTWEPFLIMTGVFTLIVIILKPLLKIVLSPLIFLTLGIASLLINALLLVLLDHLFPGVAISGLLPLFYATLLLSATHILINALFKTK